MTILKKRKEKKGLLYIIAIAIMVFAVACNKKPTQSSEFAEIDHDLPWVDTTTDKGEEVKYKTVTDTSANSPVIIVSGNKLILVYGKNDKIYYRSSQDLGETLTKETEFGTGTSGLATLSKKYPHVFFDGSTVTAVVTHGTGEAKQGYPPLAEITGSLPDGQIGINFSSWETLGIVKDGASGSAGGVLATIFGGDTTIQTAAGVGRIVSGNRKLPISQTSGTKYLVLKPQQISGVVGLSWGLDGEVKTDKEQTQIVKLDTDGSTKLDKDIAEKSGSYSITANGKITGITSNPQVGVGITEASIATDGNGNIYTFTKETKGLVFRKFSTSISGSKVN